ncbi:unnamed protein product [Peniophora sp. CBMAI 1063]|nr:unnamed protein product [Peniophora sp. CBMAI 1063]
MAYCERCDRHFPHERALGNHERDSSRHNICYECSLDFMTWEGLKEHYVLSPRHHYCQYCGSHFGDDEMYLDHLESNHWACRQHRRVFASEHGLNEHYRQHSDHVYCDLCQRYCPETGDLWAHARARHYTCPECNTYSSTEAGIKAHKQTSHPYCSECDKCFASQANLQAHLNSRRHAPAIVRCPGARCGRSFVNPSDLVQHFEAGTCPSGMTRARLNQEVVRRDRNNVITNPNRLLTGPDGARSVPTTSYLASERSWNESRACHEDLSLPQQHMHATVFGPQCTGTACRT